MTTKYPQVRFTEGVVYLLSHVNPTDYRPDDHPHWFMQGELSTGVKFAFTYESVGYVTWYCPIVLGAGLRAKILNLFRKDIRSVVNPPLVKEVDLRGLSFDDQMTRFREEFGDLLIQAVKDY